MQIVSEISSIYDIADSNIFFEDIIKFSNQLYENDLQPIEGAKEFLEKTNHNRFIGSNNIKHKTSISIIYKSFNIHKLSFASFDWGRFSVKHKYYLRCAFLYTKSSLC